MTLAAGIQLTELENDALTELANLGVSRAAASLRRMIGRQVLLSVPAVAIVTPETAARIIAERELGKAVAVHQGFEGDLRGRALLIFPETNSLELVRAVAGGELPLEDIIELEQEALAETGNVILNNCLGTIANLLRRSLKVSLPEVVRGSGPDFFGGSPADGSGKAVLFLYIDFSVNERDIRGYVAFLMDLASLASLRLLLQEFIRSTLGEASPDSHGSP
jgi:chemotaxis protein CheC